MAGELDVNSSVLLCNTPDGLMMKAIILTGRLHVLMKKYDKYCFRRSVAPLKTY